MAKFPPPRKVQGLLDKRPFGAKTKPIPYGRRGPLSDPRGVTRRDPFEADPSKRVQRLTPRLPDRGSSQPVLGKRQRLEDGSPGGIPRWLRPALWGAERVPFRQTIAGNRILPKNVRKSVMAERASVTTKAKVAKIVPGPSGIEFKRAPRIAPGRPAGVRSLIQNRLTLGEYSRGDQAEAYRWAPLDIVRRSEGARGSARRTWGNRIQALNDPSYLTSVISGGSSSWGINRLQPPSWKFPGVGDAVTIPSPGDALPSPSPVGTVPLPSEISGGGSLPSINDYRASRGGFASGGGSLADAIRFTREKASAGGSLSSAVNFTRGKASGFGIGTDQGSAFPSRSAVQGQSYFSGGAPQDVIPASSETATLGGALGNLPAMALLLVGAFLIFRR